MEIQGYRKKSLSALISAIDSATSFNQLFALAQLEGYHMQGTRDYIIAANLPYRKPGEAKAKVPETGESGVTDAEDPPKTGRFAKQKTRRNRKKQEKPTYIHQPVETKPVVREAVFDHALLERMKEQLKGMIPGYDPESFAQEMTPAVTAAGMFASTAFASTACASTACESTACESTACALTEDVSATNAAEDRPEIDAISNQTVVFAERATVTGQQTIPERRAAIVVSNAETGRRIQALLDAVDACETIIELGDLVRREKIGVQMRTQDGASNLFQKKFTGDELKPKTSPLERLKAQVRAAILAMAPEVPPESPQDRLLRAIDECQSVAELGDLVRRERIAVRMKTQNGASNLFQKKLTGKELIPDTTPLERMKAQVKEAVVAAVS